MTESNKAFEKFFKDIPEGHPCFGMDKEAARGMFKAGWLESRAVLKSDAYTCRTCRTKPGRPRQHNGIMCGIHCDECFKELVDDYRKQSW